jgi:lambda family phage portal protein
MDGAPGFVPTSGGILMPRAATEVQGTRWRGASRTLRSLQNWLPVIGSAVSDLPRHEQTTMRARSRDAFRGNMIARAALTRSRTSIVGTGLMCRPSVDFNTLGITADRAAEINAQLCADWELFADNPAECDMEATSDFYGLQSIALLSAMASGDVFALTPYQQRAGGVHGLKVQLVEADRISNPNDTSDTQGCIDGIVLDQVRPVGCWIRNTHPGDRSSTVMPKWDYYSFFGDSTGRRRVLHVWNDKERPGQVRGAPYLAPILEPLKQIDRYGGAELMAAVISSFLTVFIERDKELYNPNGDETEAFEGGNISLGSAAIMDLGPGEKANSVNPARPNANFDPFFTAVVKQIGAALEIPKDELLLHYDASYSAARAAMLQAWRFYVMRRWLLTQQFCHPVYCLRLDESVAAGRIDLPGYADPIKRNAYTRALWIGPARGSMDEEREANAAETRIRIGVSNEAMEAAAMSGEDRDAIYAQRRREIDQRRHDGTEQTFRAPQERREAA